MHVVDRISSVASKYFALFTVAGVLIAFFFPWVFTPFASMSQWLMMITMLCMGLTLNGADFKRVARQPKGLIIGVVCQFIICPALAFGIAKLLNLDDLLTLGLVLVGSVAGGVGSNVMVYISRGDLPLSVAMTTVSTLASAVLTPVLMLIFVNHLLTIPTQNILLSILQIVLGPVIIGLTIRRFLPRPASQIERAVPFISVFNTVLVLSPMVAINKDVILSVAGVIIIGGILHNVGGLILGYAISNALKMPVAQKRAVSIEVGMQNSALAATLARTHFDPITALPGVFVSIWTMVFMPLLSSYWNVKSRKKEAAASDAESHLAPIVSRKSQ